MRKSVIWALAAVLVLGLVYGGIVLTREQPEPKDETATGGQFVLSDIDPMTVMFLRYTINGEELRFKYSIKGWLVEDDEDYPLDQTAMEDMVNAMCKVTSDRLLTSDRSAFSQYGLDPAAVKVQLEDSKGNVYDYNIGDKHPTTSKFYFNVEGSDEVYTVPTLVGRGFQNHPELKSLMALPAFPLCSPSNTVSFTVERGDERREIVYLPEGSESCYTSDYKWFLKRGDELLALSPEKTEGLLNVYSGLGFVSGEALGRDEATLAKYGLDDGFYKMSVTFESASRGVLTEGFSIGRGEDGRTYGMVEGSDVIGLMAPAFDSFALEYEDYMADDVFLVPFDTVEAMTVTFGDSRYAMRRRDAEEGSEWSLNGDTLSAEAVESFFNTLRGLESEGAVPQRDGSTYMTVELTRSTPGFEAMTFTLTEHDDSFCLAELDGRVSLISRLKAMEASEALLRAVASGEGR